MDYGIGIPSWINAYQEVQRAEAAGFTHAWFYDSQLIYSDVYAAMALAAHHTSTIKLGTLVAIPSNRIAPVTASAVASLNKLAPGRIILGIGTGYTGRNTMGLPAYPIKRYREYAQQVRGLLNGEDVLYTDDVPGRERWIRLIHGQHSEFLNLDDFIPIYVAANGPRALEVVGQAGDGWVTTGMGLNAQQSFPAIAAAAEAAGRSTEKPYTVGLTTGLVLQDGESFESERVTKILGPGMVPGVHAMWEAAYGPGANLGMDNPDLAGEYHNYIREYSAAKGTPEDRLYLDVHEGHMVYLKPGEEQFIFPQVLERSLVGTGPQIIEKLEHLESIGVDNIALTANDPAGAREIIDDFAREVIHKRS